LEALPAEGTWLSELSSMSAPFSELSSTLVPVMNGVPDAAARWFEPTIELPARAIPALATTSAMVAITVAGEGRSMRHEAELPFM
jgi:hypothetical protein